MLTPMGQRRLYRGTAVCLTISALLLAPVFASTPQLLGFGTRGIALSGGVVSAPQGSEAVYYNPAGLAFLDRPQFKLGYQFSAFSLEQNNRREDVPHAMATTIGVALPLAFGGFLHRRLAIGAGFVIPTNTVLTASLPAPGTPHFPIVGHRAQTASLMGSMAVRMVDGWTIGGGVLALSALEGKIAVAPNSEGRIGSSAKDQLVAEYAPIIGTAIQADIDATNLAFGLVYRGESTARFDLPVTADLGPTFPIDVPRLNIAGIAQYDPAHVEGEIAMTRNGTRISGLVGWYRWSRFPQPIQYAASPTSYVPLPEPGLTDSWSAGIGAELSGRVWSQTSTLRGSYRWIQSPVPARTDFHAFLDNQRHVVGLGSWLQMGVFGLGLAGQYHALQPRRHYRSKDLPPIDHRGSIWSIAIDMEVRP
ncbi:MAG: hypothetical protein VX589_11315 [Myxococcota bacterium]|nr:hypothetical protein [Myxococcota bacterium]